MAFSEYIWNLYKNSPEGQQAIALFKEGGIKEIVDKYGSGNHLSGEQVEDWAGDLHDFVVHPGLPESLTLEGAEEYFEKIVQEGLRLEIPEEQPFEIGVNDPMQTIDLLEPISMWLYDVFPDYFKPYFFRNKFALLNRITDAFQIEIVEVPIKRNKKERLRFYFEICYSFLAFQLYHKMTPEEFCAFIYDFAPKYVSQVIPAELPAPSQVWFVGGDKSGVDFDFLDHPERNEISHWQGNVDTRRGDIIVMYCLSPRSYIHSIWRAETDGIADPFFYYYSNIYIGRGIKVSPIHMNELKTHFYFKTHPLVRKNFQGISGYPLTSAEYGYILDMLKEKGYDTSPLPQLYFHSTSGKEVFNERDVEVELLEPFLRDLGYTDQDWVRQLPVRMGRGERFFSDYAFLASQSDDEKVYLLVEAKYHIRTTANLNEAFRQASSYGLRLQSKVVMLVDKEAIWIYQREQESFLRDKYIKKYWGELKDPDEFLKVDKLIGKKTLKTGA